MIAVKRNKSQNNSGNEVYRVEIDWFRGIIKTLPVLSKQLFKNIGRRPSESANVLVYIDREEFANGGLTKSFAYDLEHDPYFQVRLTINSDASLAEDADVVINGLNNSNWKFLKLKDRNKIYLNVSEQSRDSAFYIRQLKEKLQEEYRTCSLEEAVA